MKKILSCVLLCAMLLSVLSIGIFAEGADSTLVDKSWYDKDQPSFVLTTAEELAGFNELMITDKVTFEDKTVYLGADIDMEGYAWNSYCIFMGTFDGYYDESYHSISNLSPANHPTNGQRRGMFGYASGTIQNFSLISPDVGNSSTASVGAIVSDRNQSALKDQPLLIENVHVVNGKVTGGTSVGGILGNTNDGGNVDLTTDVVTVKNCSFSGTITGSGNVGGMVGYAVNVNTLNIEDCEVSGTVSGSSTYVGGIVGFTKGNTTVCRCSVKGTVSGSGNGTGGLVGYVENSAITSASGSKMKIDSCHVNVQIAGAGNHKGGLVGRVHTTKSTLNFTIQNCLVEGKIVLATNQTFMAGIVAWMNYAGQTLNISFENVITVMECNSNKDGNQPHSNFRAFCSANSDKIYDKKITIRLTNVWGNSDVLNGHDQYDSNTVTVSSDSTDYGLKTTEDLKAFELTGWTQRPEKYPLPTVLISEGKTYVAGYQEKVGDSTTDYRFVAVLELADIKTLADYSDVGFMVTLIDDAGTTLYNDQKVSGKYVYTKITGTGTDGKSISYTPQDYYGDYLFALVLKDVDNGAEFTVKLTPYSTDANGKDQLGRETALTVKNK